MESLVVLTGAGMSADSGLATFRGEGGLWEGYSVYEVATPEAWESDYQRVLRFYNWRRQLVRDARPNPAHLSLVQLERKYRVNIITQNVDDLHERAGSASVLHLHGEILKARSTIDPTYIVDLGDKDIQPGDVCPQGAQLRPHVVWFGEQVPAIAEAIDIVRSAKIMLVIGTSLQVYPAAGLVPGASQAESIYVINPDIPTGRYPETIIPIRRNASDAVPELVSQLVAG